MPARPLVNWILGQEAGTGWAYSNNFQRLSRSLSGFDHTSDSSEPADVAIYFDVLIARDYRTTSRKAIVRAGGARPLDLVEGDDPAVWTSHKYYSTEAGAGAARKAPRTRYGRG